MEYPTLKVRERLTSPPPLSPPERAVGIISRTKGNKF